MYGEGLLGTQGIVLMQAAPKSCYLHQRRTTQVFWFRHQPGPMRMQSRLATADWQLRSGMLEARSSQSVESPGALQNLCEKGQLERALDHLIQMDHQGTVPTVKMYSSLLNACMKRKALAEAKRVHAHLAKHKLDSTRYLGEYLVSTFVKCCGLEDALEVFHRLPHRTVFGWTAVISGYTMSGLGREAIRTYRRMQEEGVQPSTYTFVSLIQACGSIPNLEEGKLIHAEALKHRCETDSIVCTCLVDMYARCGSMRDARTVFDQLSVRDVVSWNTMLAAYARHGNPQMVLQLYGTMQEEGVSPNERTFVSALQASGMLAEREQQGLLDDEPTKLKALETGKVLHAEAWKKGYESNVFVGNTLISMYGKYGCILDARNVFNRLSQRNLVSWNAMVAAYAQQNQPEKALKVYEQMQEEGLSPNSRTFVSAVQACGILADAVTGESKQVASLEKGKLIHAEARRKGYDSDACVGSSLVSMYGKCGSTVEAQAVFCELSHCSGVVWNAMLAAYIELGHPEKALVLYYCMRGDGVSPDGCTFVSLLQGCDKLVEREDSVFVNGQSMKAKSLMQGKGIDAAACEMGFESDIFVGSSLISLYGKCGCIVDAHIVFDRLSYRTVFAWTALLAAYVKEGHVDKAFELYQQMQEDGVTPSEITTVCLIHACSNAGALNNLGNIHAAILSTGNFPSLVVSDALIHAYGKCANMEDAQYVFDSLIQPGVTSWTSLIAGYARQGNYSRSLLCFEEMQLAGTQPDGVSFLSVLSACSHAGLVEKGVGYFESMSRDHGITPGIEHYVCMVDLLGRAGHFEMVEHLLMCMPVQPDLALWSCLLGACQKYGKIVLGEHAFDCAVRLEPQSSALYALMSNVYTDAGLWNRAKEIMELRREKGAYKKPGESWMETDKEVHTFLVGDCNQQQQNRLYDLLRQLRSELVPKEAPVLKMLLSSPNQI